MKRRHLVEANAIIAKWQVTTHVCHTGPSLFDCERRQLEKLIAEALDRAEKKPRKA